MAHTPQLHVATYHYVRDLPRTRFPEIKGMLLDDFRRQAKALPATFEMATINSALDFLTGAYRPRRDLCLMTFDDGLREHYSEVTPILAELGIQGIFFLITSCLEDFVVAPVHMNHFLMARMGIKNYRTAFMRALQDLGISKHRQRLDPAVIQSTYPWDDAATARFKYLFNFVLPPAKTALAVKRVFREYIGDETEFSSELYLSWAEAREMQRAGMAMGGHSHEHRPLATLTAPDVDWDLGRCCGLIRTNLDAQDLWPFSYPYGKADSFNPYVVKTLRRLGFHCSLCTERGANVPGADLFAIRRVDCKQITGTIVQNGYPAAATNLSIAASTTV
jgi:peptidoglycan/xylan/chitin deacetylase (PgdA/CDA1 family)